MKKNKTDSERKAEYRNFTFYMPQRQEIVIGQVMPDPMYEKAFLSGDGKGGTTFAQNTAAWD